MRWLTTITMALALCSLPLWALPRRSEQLANHRIRTAEHRTVQFGLASWYGARFQHNVTASGTRFDDGKLTAAHRTLPLGTSVKVTNLKNGRSVVVKVTDRGPWVRGRMIDVSRAAAERLGFKHRGLARVKVAVIRSPDQAAAGSPAATGTDEGE
jgi:rare lipoprotein A